ncbi:MAG TPA: GNAT family N-acetyltransferase, partial [Capillimicrobium sp.]
MASPSVTQPVADWTALFNDPRFHALNAGPGERPLHLVAERDGRVAGSLGGVLEPDGTFVCGHSAPFGGPDLARPRETPEAVDAILDDLLAQLEAGGAHAVRVKLKPPSWSENEALLLHGLLRRGFRVDDCDLSFAIDLRGVRRLDDHLDRLRSSARRAVRQLADGPFRFTTAADDAAWDRAWGVIEANRAAKGYRLALSGDYVRRARDTFGDRVRLSLLEHAGEPCAAALVYRVAPRKDLLVA